MIGREEILALIPHQGTMCLWDEVSEWDDGRIHLRTASHAREENPLRDAGQLRAVHLCEYGAQAMAVHGGLIARAAGGTAPPGMLVALRNVQLHVARIDGLDGALECEATLLAAGEASQQYAFLVRHAGDALAEGRATVMLAPAMQAAG